MATGRENIERSIIEKEHEMVNGKSSHKKLSEPGKQAVKNIEQKLQDKSKKKIPVKKDTLTVSKKTTDDKTVAKKKSPAKIEKKVDAPETAKKVNRTIAKKSPKSNVKKTVPDKTIRLIFQLRFHTRPGENLFIIGDHEAFGNNDVNKALPLQYLNEQMWVASADIDITSVDAAGITYNYLLKHQDNFTVYDWGNDKKIDALLLKFEEVLITDAWNHAGYFENAFYTEPFQNVLLKKNYTDVKVKEPKNFTHIFRVKTPLLAKGQTVCLLGASKETSEWNEAAPILLSSKQGDLFYSVSLDLSHVDLPLVYKYGVYDTKNKKFIRYEDGNNRLLYHAHAVAQNKITVINDGFVRLPSASWKGAGVSIPVFSLRSKEGWGVGKFGDLKLLVDWAKKTGLQLIQILPVNDTSATDTWADSYPYAAISAFALHPMYLNIQDVVSKANKHLLDEVKKEKEDLNKKDSVDYLAVNKLKWSIIEKIYPSQKDETFSSAEYKNFFTNNRHWLIPYSAFCYFRKLYNTADFNSWPSHKQYVREDANALFDDPKTFDAVAIHCFVQFHLHAQLQDAAKYAHDNGIIIKGDIPIGIYRYGVDAWQQPGLYHMELQAGAPPDDFAVKGQNWGFPTYNWKKMGDDHFAWWKQRFEQMSNYFDAFRIDHVLGFFRIWSIPMDAIEGIMGHFEPCIPVHINEFHERQIWFDHHRYCKPFINDQVLWDITGDQAEHFKHNFVQPDGYGNYNLRPEFSTQRDVEDYFNLREANEYNNRTRQQLFDLISNVILFEAEGSQGLQFHFRFGMESTKSFQYLDQHTQQQLRDLYVDYFFRRQDTFWMKEAMQKLPALKRVTNMLICGEDLGLVPTCVPDVMNQLGLLSLEIQRMPKQTHREFFHPNDAPYLSVVTPSTHDMSTIRGWWEEDRTKTQRFFNYELGQWGDAPFFCEDWVNKAVVVQHLYSTAMWSIFQWQDIMGINKKLRRENPHEERINVPSNPKNHWKYRMHLYLEDLLNEDEFNNELHGYLIACGRAPKE